MKSLIHVFRLVRINNLVIFAITLIFTYLFLTGHSLTEVFSISFLVFLTGCICVMAGGYVINDIYDVKADSINKPSQLVVVEKLSKKFALIIYILLTVTGLILGSFSGVIILALFVSVAALLYLYSLYFQNIALVGNIIISLLTALTLWIVFVFDSQNVAVSYIVFYSLFAFVTTLIREIVKDIEDNEGDIVAGSSSVIRRFGFRPTRIINLALSLGMILFSWAFAIFLFVNSKNIMSLYFSVLVNILFIYLYVLIKKASFKPEFTKISNLLKWILVAGFASMPLIKLM